MVYESLLNKGKKPKNEEIEEIIRDKLSLWLEMEIYIKDKYDFTKELIFFTKKYVWAIRYIRNGRTMIYLFLEQGAFSVLLVLGKKKSEEINLFEGSGKTTRHIKIRSKEDINEDKITQQVKMVY